MTEHCPDPDVAAEITLAEFAILAAAATVVTREREYRHEQLAVRSRPAPLMPAFGGVGEARHQRNLNLAVDSPLYVPGSLYYRKLAPERAVSSSFLAGSGLRPCPSRRNVCEPRRPAGRIPAGQD